MEENNITICIEAHDILKLEDTYENNVFNDMKSNELYLNMIKIYDFFTKYDAIVKYYDDINKPLPDEVKQVKDGIIKYNNEGNHTTTTDTLNFFNDLFSLSVNLLKLKDSLNNSSEDGLNRDDKRNLINNIDSYYDSIKQDDASDKLKEFAKKINEQLTQIVKNSKSNQNLVEGVGKIIYTIENIFDDKYKQKNNNLQNIINKFNSNNYTRIIDRHYDNLKYLSKNKENHSTEFVERKIISYLIQDYRHKLYKGNKKNEEPNINGDGKYNFDGINDLKSKYDIVLERNNGEESLHQFIQLLANTNMYSSQKDYYYNIISDIHSKINVNKELSNEEKRVYYNILNNSIKSYIKTNQSFGIASNDKMISISFNDKILNEQVQFMLYTSVNKDYYRINNMCSDIANHITTRFNTTNYNASLYKDNLNNIVLALKEYHNYIKSQAYSEKYMKLYDEFLDKFTSHLSDNINKSNILENEKNESLNLLFNKFKEELNYTISPTKIQIPINIDKNKYTKSLRDMEEKIINSMMYSLTKHPEYTKHLTNIGLHKKTDKINFEFNDKKLLDDYEIEDNNTVGISNSADKKIVKDKLLQLQLNNKSNLQDQENNKNVLETGDRLNAFIHAMFGKVNSKSNYNIFYNSILDKLINNYLSQGNISDEDLQLQYKIFTSARQRFKQSKHLVYNTPIKKIGSVAYANSLKNCDDIERYLKLLPFNIDLELNRYQSMSKEVAIEHANSIIRSEITNLNKLLVLDGNHKNKDKYYKAFIDTCISSLLEYKKYANNDNIKHADDLYNYVILQLKEQISKVQNNSELEQYLQKGLQDKLHYHDIDFMDNNKIIDDYIMKDLKQLFTGDITTPLFKPGRKSIEKSGSNSLKYQYNSSVLTDKISDVIRKRVMKFKDISDRLQKLKKILDKQKDLDLANKNNNMNDRTRFQQELFNLIEAYNSKYNHNTDINFSDNSSWKNVIKDLNTSYESLLLKKKNIVESNKEFFNIITIKLINADELFKKFRGIALNENKFLSLLYFLKNTYDSLSMSHTNMEEGGYKGGAVESYAKAFDYLLNVKGSDTLLKLITENTYLMDLLKSNTLGRKGMIRSLLRNNMRADNKTSKLFNQDKATTILYAYIAFDRTELSDIAKDLVNELEIVNADSVENSCENRYRYVGQIIGGLLTTIVNDNNKKSNIKDKIIDYIKSIVSKSEVVNDKLLPTLFKSMYEYTKTIGDDKYKEIVLQALLESKRVIFANNTSITSGTKGILSEITLNNIAEFGFNHVFGSTRNKNNINLNNLIEDYLSYETGDDNDKHITSINKLLNKSSILKRNKNYEAIINIFEAKLKNIDSSGNNKNQLLAKTVKLFNNFISMDINNAYTYNGNIEERSDTIFSNATKFISTFLEYNNSNTEYLSSLSSSMADILNSGILQADKVNFDIVHDDDDDDINIHSAIPEAIIESFSVKYVELLNSNYSSLNKANYNTTDNITDDYKKAIDSLLDKVGENGRDVIKNANKYLICCSVASTIIENNCNTNPKKDLELLLHVSNQLDKKTLSKWFKSVVQHINTKGKDSKTSDDIKRKFLLLTSLIYSNDNLTPHDRREYLDILINNISENELTSLSFFDSDNNEASLVCNILDDDVINKLGSFIKDNTDNDIQSSKNNRHIYDNDITFGSDLISYTNDSLSHNKGSGNTNQSYATGDSYEEDDKSDDIKEAARRLNTKVKDMITNDILFSLYRNKLKSDNFNFLLLKNKSKNNMELFDYIVNNINDADQNSKVEVALQILNNQKYVDGLNFNHTTDVVSHSNDMSHDQSTTYDNKDEAELIKSLSHGTEKSTFLPEYEDRKNKIIQLSNKLNDNGILSLFYGLMNNFNKNIYSDDLVKSDVSTIMDICIHRNKEHLLQTTSLALCTSLFRYNNDKSSNIDYDSFEELFNKYVDNINTTGYGDYLVDNCKILFSTSCSSLLELKKLPKMQGSLKDLDCNNYHIRFTEFTNCVSDCFCNINNENVRNNVLFAFADVINTLDADNKDKTFLMFGLLCSVARHEIRKDNIDDVYNNSIFNYMLERIYPNSDEMQDYMKHMVYNRIASDLSSIGMEPNVDEGKLDGMMENLHVLCGRTENVIDDSQYTYNDNNNMRNIPTENLNTYFRDMLNHSRTPLSDENSTTMSITNNQ